MNLVCALIFLLPLVFGAETQRIKLTKQNVDANSITVSGISSGAAMAMQFHIAHSSQIAGAGIFAGVPYLCGNGGAIPATAICMENPGLTNVEFLLNEARIYSKAGVIDNLSNLNGDRVYIFQGLNDSVVKFKSGQNVEEMYLKLGVHPKTVFNYPAEHGQITDDYGSACSAKSTGTQYINNCNYKGAFEMLNHLYGGNLNAPATGNLPGDFYEFDQGEFFHFTLPVASSMDNTGYIYIPSGCKSGTTTCKLHIALHGCSQCRSDVSTIYATKTGYLEAAETNNIIVLFPQATSTLFNLLCCWNWYGYLTDNAIYATKTGSQVMAIHRMMSRIVG